MQIRLERLAGWWRRTVFLVVNVRSFFALSALASSLMVAGARPHLTDFARESEEWFRSADGLRITTNILSWQDDYGSWPKNKDTSRLPFSGDRKSLHGTFDNGATTGELRFLARAYALTGSEQCKQAVLKGIDVILKAQYPTGGWPQFYPPDTQYHRHITFNDDAMVRVMNFLREVADSKTFAFVDEGRQKASQASFDRGIDCILKCQIKVNGKPTVWCAQHDEVDLSPAGGRKYELASLSGGESDGVLSLLMSLPNPTPEVRRAIKAGADWYAGAKQTGIKIERLNGERVLTKDTNAPPLWARFYDLENGKPIFCDRDAIKKYSFMEIGRERRNGYRWYGDWGEAVAADYAKWQAKWEKSAKDAN
ncbi:MAG TPA: pectate lyase [Candidatus Dormibacteraeota bacterium]|nr:pectate lyase [Candidatus Dormibacteraeota bacterium]